MGKYTVKILIYPDNVCICVNDKQVLFYDGEDYQTFIDNKTERFLEFKNALQYFQKNIKLKLSQKIIKDFKDTVKKEYKIKTGEETNEKNIKRKKNCDSSRII